MILSIATEELGGRCLYPLLCSVDNNLVFYSCSPGEVVLQLCSSVSLYTTGLSYCCGSEMMRHSHRQHMRTKFVLIAEHSSVSLCTEIVMSAFFSLLLCFIVRELVLCCGLCFMSHW